MGDEYVEIGHTPPSTFGMFDVFHNKKEKLFMLKTVERN